MAVPFPHISFLLSFVLFWFTFLKQLGTKGKVECCVGVKVGSFEDHGADAELEMEAQPFPQNTLPLV